MNKKRMLIIRIAAVAVLAAIAWWMTIIGRGHTVYLDAKKIEVNGTEYKPAYKTEVYVKGERQYVAACHRWHHPQRLVAPALSALQFQHGGGG